MKDSFPGFYRPTENDFRKLWESSTFVFDTNILLNLHRFPEEARADLFAILSSLEERIWIPFQVGLEYQRKRVNVIAEQKGRFEEVKNSVTDVLGKLEADFLKWGIPERHSIIDASEFLTKLKPIISEFLEKLAEWEKDHSNALNEDSIREKIDHLFKKKIGRMPDQNYIDKIIKEGEIRYEKKMPPGFKDQKKEKDPNNLYSYGGVFYEGKYGDLISWNQIIDHAKEKKLKSLVFVTDDEKEDWWWKYNSQGQKKLGPRPELIEEIKRKAGVDNFYIYNTESFFKHAQLFLDSKINEKSIEQIRETRNAYMHQNEWMKWTQTTELAVGAWLNEQYPNFRIEHGRWPDFKVYDYETDKIYGYEVMAGPKGSLLVRIRDRLFRAYQDVKEGHLNSIEIIVVLREPEETSDFLSSLQKIEIRPGIKISYGKLIDEGNGGLEKYVQLGKIS